MEAKKFKVIIVEDVKLELKGTEEIFRHEIPDAEVIGTAMTEQEFWSLMETGVPDLVLLDLGLGGSIRRAGELISFRCRHCYYGRKSWRFKNIYFINGILARH